MKNPVVEEDNVEDLGDESTWSDAYAELMGDDDEVDVFFILPREEDLPDPEEMDDPGSLLILRVTGLPDDAHAWVH